jgi:hypothetical protein
MAQNELLDKDVQLQHVMFFFFYKAQIAMAQNELLDKDVQLQHVMFFGQGLIIYIHY